MLAISCMIEMQLHREIENSKNRFFASFNSLDISDYSIFTMILNLNLSRLHRSFFSSRSDA
jgi:cytidylate kinase